MNLTSEQNTPEEFKYAGLNNEQILKVYYSMKRQQEVMDNNLAKNKLLRLVEQRGMFDYKMVDVPDEMIAQFKQTEYYKLIGSVVNTLAPIVSLLEECDDALKALSDELR